MVQVDKGLQWGNKTKVIQVDLGTFTYILAYSGLFRALCNLPYSKPWYIQNQKPRHI